MTHQDLAKLLNGRNVGEEITIEEEKLANSFQLAVVFVDDEDILKLRGVINKEISCYNEYAIYIKNGKLFVNECSHDDCPYFEELKGYAWKIQAVWRSNKNSPGSWNFITTMPHSTFEIMNGKQVWCVGIVFSV